MRNPDENLDEFGLDFEQQETPTELLGKFRLPSSVVREAERALVD